MSAPLSSSLGIDSAGFNGATLVFAANKEQLAWPFSTV
jgi:hypothetical protein